MADTKTWTWSRYGVTLEADHLLWFEELGPVAFASGGACEQTLADFAKRGPWVDGVPADVIAELKASIAERSIAGDDVAQEPR